jgi:hypothetical protein
VNRTDHLVEVVLSHQFSHLLSAAQMHSYLDTLENLDLREHHLHPVDFLLLGSDIDKIIASWRKFQGLLRDKDVTMVSEAQSSQTVFRRNA